MNKKIVWIIIIALILIAFAVWALLSWSSKGYLFIGDGWGNTPAQALSKAANRSADSPKNLTASLILETKDIDDITIMTFVSQADTLVTLTFERNEKGQYRVSDYAEEVSLDEPTSFLLSGNPEQHVATPYWHCNSFLSGWCYADASFTVNGIAPAKKTYIFDCQGKRRSINSWWIEEFPSQEEINIEYAD